MPEGRFEGRPGGLAMAARTAAGITEVPDPNPPIKAPTAAQAAPPAATTPTPLRRCRRRRSGPPERRARGVRHVAAAPPTPASTGPAAGRSAGAPGAPADRTGAGVNSSRRISSYSSSKLMV